ncbi:signal transduction histidine-protein kinase BaeS [bacterium BMS3Abin01]|nr:signal transduction histidine-protein kinase BaeS [bacterium BMS3Abin01]HDY69826.1 HAMP domain-containing protein [Actinomycetota bacterium]
MIKQGLQLRWKLLATFLLVIAVGIGVIIIITRQLTLSSYSEHLRNMTGGGMGGMMSSMSTDLDRAFRQALNYALLWGGLAAVAAAVVVSFFISRRITRPVHEMAAATRQIAAGDFSRRVKEGSSDELGNLAQSLNRMAESLEQSEQQRRDLMANIAHELRTPLSSISGYMEGLADGVVPAEKETYDLVRQEAGRLNRLVDDLQQLSRAESGEEQLNPVSIPLAGFLERVRRKMEPRFVAKGVSLTIDGENEGVTVTADEDKLDQVMINLLDNALRHTDGGGGVTLSADRYEGRVFLVVADSGGGIPAADLPHIFDRFYRADKSRSRDSGGSGIGLTIARSYVEAMGGGISAASTPGTGTRITLSFPAS